MFMHGGSGYNKNCQRKVSVSHNDLEKCVVQIKQGYQYSDLQTVMIPKCELEELVILRD